MKQAQKMAYRSFLVRNIDGVCRSGLKIVIHICTLYIKRKICGLVPFRIPFNSKITLEYSVTALECLFGMKCQAESFRLWIDRDVDSLEFVTGLAPKFCLQARGGVADIFLPLTPHAPALFTLFRFESALITEIKVRKII